MQINVPYHLDDLSAVVGRAVGLDEGFVLARDPAINIATAYRIWRKDGGFGAWSCNQP